MIYKTLFLLLTLTSSVFARTITENENSTCSGEVGNILRKLRSAMSDTNNTKIEIQAYIVSKDYAHQNEYIIEYDKRLQFITKFTGSLGVAVITQTKAGLWTDSRLTDLIQAEKQIDSNCWLLMKDDNQEVPTMTEWLIENLPEGSNVGVDPLIMPYDVFNSTLRQLEKHKIKLVGINKNLVDVIWTDKPLENTSPIEPLNLKYSGRSAGKKISELRTKLTHYNADSIILTCLDEIAWLLNLRASDIPYNPVFYSYLIVTKEYLLLFVNHERITPTIVKHLQKEEAVCIIRNYNEILDGVKELVNFTSGNIITSKDVSQAIYENIPTKRIIQIRPSIVGQMKSIKNDIEAENMKQAHIRDGLALIRYLHWLDTVIDEQNVTEKSGASKLEQFRSEQENYKGLSHESISAFGSNTAIVYYDATKETGVRITRDKIYLINSGGQYWDGTTDVTRTVHYGTPTAFEKECFTRVLKGFIAFATSIFPKNTSFEYFDYVAKRHLWQVGLDYNEITGHGIGAYLNVHEYPPFITAAALRGPVALENMFISNEPGYYKTNSFGVKLEDIFQIVKTNNTDAFNGGGALTFRTMTLVPIQIKLIDISMLTIEEKEYLNNYHQMVLDTIGPILLKQNLTETYQWLAKETINIE